MGGHRAILGGKGNLDMRSQNVSLINPEPGTGSPPHLPPRSDH